MLDIPMLPVGKDEEARMEVSPGLKGVAGREVELKGEEAYAPTDMAVRRSDGAHVPGESPPPGYKA